MIPVLVAAVKSLKNAVEHRASQHFLASGAFHKTRRTVADIGRFWSITRITK